ncbi:MAG TPA: hypothetical protein VFP55_02645 [Solirubrobacteraceae bacterium]|nr:hypothetical protein [Solirubrobacteraceae bacterium]
MDDEKRLSMEEVEAEGAVSLPNKEVLSLLDVNANVDLGLDLAAPVDLAAAANLNVAAPIEAGASANVLSPDGTAVGMAQQSGTIEQGIAGSATADAPQHATVDQSANTGSNPTPTPTGTAAGATSGGSTSGGVSSLLNDGNLLDANVNLNANADLAAPVDGAVAANANVAAPVDAAVGANVGSPGAAAEAVAPQDVNIEQNMDATASAQATQNAGVSQQ